MDFRMHYRYATSYFLLQNLCIHLKLNDRLVVLNDRLVVLNDRLVVLNDRLVVLNDRLVVF